MSRRKDHPYRCAQCNGIITAADDLITVNVSGAATAAHRQCPVDGEGGWWCCQNCGSLAQLTFQQGFCTKCGCTEEEFYRDGEFK